jgi:endonuclease/exonuclease/phosphatase family metal-dependent hydrolase
MVARWAVARRPWLPAWLAGVITRLHQGFFRSAISGQANAILLRPPLAVRDHRERQISVGPRERRVCHVVRADGLVVGNLHASNDARHRDVAAEELVRALELVDDVARGGDVRVLAGDFNLFPRELPELPGWSAYGPGVDHVIARDAPATPLAVWPQERRGHGDRLLSDHAPVETTIG